MGDFEDRLRAARAYADFTAEEVAERMGVSLSTVRRIEKGREMKPFERRTIIAGYAEVCELPAAFFEADFGRLDAEPTDSHDERLARLEDALGQIGRELHEHSQATAKELERFDSVASQMQASAVRREDFDHAIRLITEGIHALSQKEPPP